MISPNQVINTSTFYTAPAQYNPNTTVHPFDPSQSMQAIQLQHSGKVYPSGLPSNQPAVVQTYGVNLSILTPTGRVVRTNINPICRYNFAIEQYNEKENQIQGIELKKIPFCSCLGWIYDLVIYFYTYFFESITCNLPGRSICWSLLMLCLYVGILILPYISIVQFVISAFYFLYYIVGICFFVHNNFKLDSNEFTQNMIEARLIPSYPKDMTNKYYKLEEENIRVIILSHPQISAFTMLQKRGVSAFMAYQNDFVTERYAYIKSPRMVAFHICFMTFSVLGLVVSIKIFPVLYGQPATTS